MISQLMKLKVHIKTLLLLIEYQEPGDKLHSSAMHVQVYHDHLLADSSERPAGLFSNGPHGEFKFFSTFSGTLLVTGHPESV